MLPWIIGDDSEVHMQNYKTNIEVEQRLTSNPFRYRSGISTSIQLISFIFISSIFWPQLARAGVDFRSGTAPLRAQARDLALRLDEAAAVVDDLVDAEPRRDARGALSKG